MSLEKNEKRYFDRQEELKAGLSFLISEAAAAFDTAIGEPDSVSEEMDKLILLFRVLDEEIDEGQFKGIEDKVELFKLKIEKFLENIKPYCPKNEIPKNQVN